MRAAFFYLLPLLMLFSCTNDESASERASSVNQTQTDVSKSVYERDQNSFSPTEESMGQLVYVPVYSHIYQQDRQKTFNLTATLSIRNADPFRSISIYEVLYYDSNGQMIQSYIDEPAELEPLASTSFVIEERDLRGGVGANFLVTWQSDEGVYPPVIEAVMISTSQQQGISFLSVGRVIENHQPDTGQAE